MISFLTEENTKLIVPFIHDKDYEEIEESKTESVRTRNDNFLCCRIVSFFICLKGDEKMNKSFKEQLNQWEKQHKDLIRKERETNRRRKLESLSDDEIKDLMGVNRDTYRRGRGGAIRRK